MSIELLDRWDDLYGYMRYMDLAINEDEYVKVEWFDRQWNLIPSMPHTYNVYDIQSDEPLRNLTDDEWDEVCEFVIEQLLVEEKMEERYKAKGA